MRRKKKEINFEVGQNIFCFEAQNYMESSSNLSKISKKNWSQSVKLFECYGDSKKLNAKHRGNALYQKLLPEYFFFSLSGHKSNSFIRFRNGKPVGNVKTIYLCLIQCSQKLSDQRQSHTDEKKLWRLKKKTCKTPW